MLDLGCSQLQHLPGDYNHFHRRDCAGIQRGLIHSLSKSHRQVESATSPGHRTMLRVQLGSLCRWNKTNLMLDAVIHTQIHTHVHTYARTGASRRLRLSAGQRKNIWGQVAPERGVTFFFTPSHSQSEVGGGWPLVGEGVVISLWSSQAHRWSSIRTQGEVRDATSGRSA